MASLALLWSISPGKNRKYIDDIRDKLGRVGHALGVVCEVGQFVPLGSVEHQMRSVADCLETLQVLDIGHDRGEWEEERQENRLNAFPRTGKCHIDKKVEGKDGVRRMD